MAKNVEIREVQYNAVPAVDIPLASGNGNATFYDNSEATINSGGQMRSGVKAVGADGTVYTGSIPEKSAATYNPSTSNQSIAADQYLEGTQTIAAVTVSGLTAANIAAGVTVKVGCASDDDCVASVTGALAAAVISQDPTTKVLSIS